MNSPTNQNWMLWLKNGYPFWNPSKWNLLDYNLRSPCALILKTTAKGFPFRVNRRSPGPSDPAPAFAPPSPRAPPAQARCAARPWRSGEPSAERGERRRFEPQCPWDWFEGKQRCGKGTLAKGLFLLRCPALRFVGLKGNQSIPQQQQTYLSISQRRRKAQGARRKAQGATLRTTCFCVCSSESNSFLECVERITSALSHET